MKIKSIALILIFLSCPLFLHSAGIPIEVAKGDPEVAEFIKNQSQQNKDAAYKEMDTARKQVLDEKIKVDEAIKTIKDKIQIIIKEEQTLKKLSEKIVGAEANQRYIDIALAKAAAFKEQAAEQFRAGGTKEEREKAKRVIELLEEQKNKFLEETNLKTIAKDPKISKDAPENARAMAEKGKVAAEFVEKIDDEIYQQKLITGEKWDTRTKLKVTGAITAGIMLALMAKYFQSGDSVNAPVDLGISGSGSENIGSPNTQGILPEGSAAGMQGTSLAGTPSVQASDAPVSTSTLNVQVPAPNQEPEIKSVTSTVISEITPTPEAANIKSKTENTQLPITDEDFDRLMEQQKELELEAIERDNIIKAGERAAEESYLEEREEKRRRSDKAALEALLKEDALEALLKEEESRLAAPRLATDEEYLKKIETETLTQSTVEPTPESTSDETNVTPDPENVTLDPENVTLDPENVTLDPENVTLDPENVTTDPENVTTDPENVTLDPENVTPDPGNVTLDPGNVTLDPGNVITDPGNVITDPENVITDPENVITDPENVTTDASAVTTDASAVTTDATPAETPAETPTETPAVTTETPTETPAETPVETSTETPIQTTEIEKELSGESEGLTEEKRLKEAAQAVRDFVAEETELESLAKDIPKDSIPRSEVAAVSSTQTDQTDVTLDEHDIDPKMLEYALAELQKERENALQRGDENKVAEIDEMLEFIRQRGVALFVGDEENLSQSIEGVDVTEDKAGTQVTLANETSDQANITLTPETEQTLPFITTTNEDSSQMRVAPNQKPSSYRANQPTYEKQSEESRQEPVVHEKVAIEVEPDTRTSEEKEAERKYWIDKTREELQNELTQAIEDNDPVKIKDLQEKLELNDDELLEATSRFILCSGESCDVPIKSDMLKDETVAPSSKDLQIQSDEPESKAIHQSSETNQLKENLSSGHDKEMEEMIMQRFETDAAKMEDFLREKASKGGEEAKVAEIIRGRWLLYLVYGRQEIAKELAKDNPNYELILEGLERNSFEHVEKDWDDKMQQHYEYEKHRVW